MADPAPAPTPAATIAPPTAPASPPAAVDTKAEAAAPAMEPSTVSLGGYLQPQFRMRQNSPAQFDQDGFRFARARLISRSSVHAGNLELSTYVEAELQPQFALQDAYATASRTWKQGEHELPGKLELSAGQMRVPVSRQNLLSDSRMSFVDKAQLATIAPDRDLGARITAAPPKLPVKVILGAYNGETKNQVENINENYLFAARLEVSPWGRDAKLAESAFGGKVLTLGLSYAHNNLSSMADTREHVTYLGADLFASYKGLSASGEYLWVKHDLGDSGGSYHANGWMAQAAYMPSIELPPYKQSRIEIAARVEEIDRNDAIPITMIGDPNQSVREYTGVLSYYMREHVLKAQLAFNHFQEIEDKTITGVDAAYPNDQLLLQITYILE